MGLDRLLLDSDIPPAPTNSIGDESFDSSNMVIILVALLCALICALVLNSVARCALRCTRSRLPDDHDDGAAPRHGAAAGLDKEALRQIPVAIYKSGMRIPAATECTICLGEFGQGEKVRILPRCNHGFHVTCIDKWLVLHSSCPTCRQPLVELEHKLVSTVGEEFVSVEIR